MKSNRSLAERAFRSMANFLDYWMISILDQITSAISTSRSIKVRTGLNGIRAATCSSTTYMVLRSLVGNLSPAELISAGGRRSLEITHRGQLADVAGVQLLSMHSNGARECFTFSIFLPAMP
jgi:hypothetical protein